jgi:hypothetical protein
LRREPARARRPCLNPPGSIGCSDETHDGSAERSFAESRTCPWCGERIAAAGEPLSPRRLAVLQKKHYRRACPGIGNAIPGHPGGGWLSPEGRYFPCPDFQHLAIADRIAAQLRIRVGAGGAGAALERRGWLHINDNGHVIDDDDVLDVNPTQAQLDALFDLAELHPSMRDELLAALNREQIRTAG